MQAQRVVSDALLVVGAAVTASGLLVKVAVNIKKALDCLKDSKNEKGRNGKS